MQDLRCEHKKHGVLLSNGVAEVKCSSRFCGATRETVVFHYFSVETGEMLETKKFKNPNMKGN